MTQDNFRYRSFRKRESKKRQKERHGKYTDTNWWIGREDVLVQVNRGFAQQRGERRASTPLSFPLSSPSAWPWQHRSVSPEGHV